MKPHPAFPYPLYLVISQKDCLHLPFNTVLEEAIRGGVDIVQLREKHCTDEDFFAKGVITKSITDHFNIPLIINDNIQVAKAVGAFGIHVGTTDSPPTAVREFLGEEYTIGYSIEDWKQLDTAESATADYLAVSPIFRTDTKTDTITEWGINGLAEIRQKTDKPIIAIGNIHLHNAKEIMHAGADAIAVVSEICASKNPRLSAQRLKEAIQSHFTI